MTGASTCTVVVAVTLGPDADEPLRQAHRLARAIAANLVGCHVVITEERRRSAASSDEPVTRTQRVLRARMSSMPELRTGGFEAIAVTGIRPDHEITRIADELGAELIVLGEPRHGRIGRWLHGCTIDRVVQRADVPVLVARLSPDTNRILVATDLSNLTFPAIAAAAAQSSMLDAEVVALHCVNPPPSVSGLHHIHESSADFLPRLAHRTRRARELLELAMRRHGLAAEPHIEVGSSASAIVNAAERTGAGLVVIGAHRRSRFERFMIGGVSDRVIRRAPCSVLVVPMVPRPEESRRRVQPLPA